MTRITVLRHGETLWNRAGRMQGQTDIELSDLGREQAIAAAEELREEAFDAIVSSPLRRAANTAFAVADKLGLDVRLDARFGEINVGSWSGQKGTDVAAEMPDRAAKFHAGIDYRRSSTGETAAEVADRVEAAVNDIVAEFPDGNVLVVAHGYLTQVMVSRLLGLEGHGNRLGVLGNARRAVIQWTHGHWTLVAYNVGGEGRPTLVDSALRSARASRT